MGSETVASAVLGVSGIHNGTFRRCLKTTRPLIKLERYKNQRPLRTPQILRLDRGGVLGDSETLPA